jgi:hypothetical protein
VHQRPGADPGHVYLFEMVEEVEPEKKVCTVDGVEKF